MPAGFPDSADLFCEEDEDFVSSLWPVSVSKKDSRIYDLPIGIYEPSMKSSAIAVRGQHSMRGISRCVDSRK